MSSGADVVSEPRRLANNVSRFAYRPDQNQLSDIQQSNTTSLPPSKSPGMSFSPPAQSRDATNSSRFFPTTPSNGTVLVPDSSPLTQDSKRTPYQPYQYARDGPSIPGLSLHNSYNQNFKSHADPLSRPSGFVASTGVNNALITRSTPPAARRTIEVDEESDNERPRKRANVSILSPDPLDILVSSSPSSPEVLRAGQSRKTMPNKSIVSPLSMSSEASHSDGKASVASPSKPGMMRNEPAKDDALIKFRMVNPGVSLDNIDAAFHMAKGDIRVATTYLLDPNFSASSFKSTSSSTPNSARVVGKVKEVEEEREAKRAQQKQLASRSTIYKNRQVMDSPSPSTSSIPATPIVVDADSSPIRPRPGRTKPRKQIIESASEESEGDEDDVQDVFEMETLQNFNKLGQDALRELTGCTIEQAEKIISLRPFGSVDDLKKRLGQDRKKAGPAGISPRLFDDCVEIYEGYGNVDQILKDCERIGKELKKAIDAWTGGDRVKGNRKGKEREEASTIQDDLADDGALNLVSISGLSSATGLITRLPSLLAPGVQLKDYQLTGINWLRLLHSKKYSCILADEMGLGKTVQVISFFAQLKEQGCAGPHLVVVPSSTLENWCREFERFCPSIAIETYYGNKNDRPYLRDKLLRTQLGTDTKKGKNWEVLITTYNLAVGDSSDRKFFRRVPWNTCVFDEGHVLKNFQSQRYTALTRIDSEWKLLLTGTPLQNNLQELVSVMGFILPDKFGDEVSTHLRAIFKVKGDSKQLLAEERVKRAKTMMTPFVLRRRKDQVLKDLPKKTERIEWCSLSTLQESIYNDARRRSRKTLMDEAGDDVEDPNGGSKQPAKKGRGNPRGKDKKYSENTSNVLMDLRKAASHPMLFRTHFTDAKLTTMTRLLLKEPDFRKRGAIYEFVKEDMEVMTDSELQLFCRTYKSTQKLLLDEDCYIDSGKVKMMLGLLERYKAEGRKCLIFSQFTQILDILQVVLKQRSIKHLVLTGSTAVDVRQGLVDEFTEDESIPVFLLSTKAGGMGINLTAASVVILFDQDFNPHNDKQAADRAYRIGQKRDVEIVKLISRGTIEEDMLRLGQTKLALDEAVAGDAEEGAGEGKAEKIMRTSLMDSLRKQFEAEEKGVPSAEVPVPAPAANANGMDPSQTTEAETKLKAMNVDSEDSDLTDLDAA